LDNETITVVSGLPRSGTSMMMKMLAAGGLEILTDNIRVADEDNPKGYYEFEKVKQLENDHAWLEDAKGKAVKVISELLKCLPGKYSYKIIFMRRKIDEILASQRQMLIRRGEPADDISDAKITKMFFAHLQKVERWLEQQPNMDVLYINYNAVLKNPGDGIQEISRFLGNRLNTQSISHVIDNTLYRQRK